MLFMCSIVMYICNERPVYISPIAVFTYSTVARTVKRISFVFVQSSTPSFSVIFFSLGDRETLAWFQC